MDTNLEHMFKSISFFKYIFYFESPRYFLKHVPKDFGSVVGDPTNQTTNDI